MWKTQTMSSTKREEKKRPIITYKVWLAFWVAGVILFLFDAVYGNIIILVSAFVMFFVSLVISVFICQQGEKQVNE